MAGAAKHLHPSNLALSGPRHLPSPAFDQERTGWTWVLGVTAAVYNPILRVHLTREIWSLVNVVTIGIAVASILVLKDKPRPGPAPPESTATAR